MPPKVSPKAHPIGLRIKEIRRYLGKPRRAWSQRELAAALTMDPRTLRRREADGEIDGSTATALAALAQCDVTWILSGEGRGPGQVPEPAPEPRGKTTFRLPRLPGRRPAELENTLGMVRDALVGAVDRALARDHELEVTRRGYQILGGLFLDLAVQLQLNGVDTRELLTVARELQKLGGGT